MCIPGIFLWVNCVASCLAIPLVTILTRFMNYALFSIVVGPLWNIFPFFCEKHLFT